MSILFLIRLATMLMPVLLLVSWLRWRQRRQGNEGMKEDIKPLIIQFSVIIFFMLLLNLSLYWYDSARAPAQSLYVPPHMEDGVLIPGHFKAPPAQQAREALEGEKPASKAVTDGEASNPKTKDPE